MGKSLSDMCPHLLDLARLLMVSSAKAALRRTAAPQCILQPESCLPALHGLPPSLQTPLIPTLGTYFSLPWGASSLLFGTCFLHSPLPHWGFQVEKITRHCHAFEGFQAMCPWIPHCPSSTFESACGELLQLSLLLRRKPALHPVRDS